MITGFDKALTAIIVPLIAGLLVKFANVNLNDATTQALTIVVLAAVTGFLTWLVPNKPATT